MAVSALAQTPISGTLSGTIPAGVYHATGSLTIPAGTTVTLNAGVIIKLTGGQEVAVLGTLLANGTAQNPVIFTDLNDDSAGGDTNGNGPSVGNPTAWRGMLFHPTAGASVLNRVDVRYGGHGYVSNFHLNGCNPTFIDCVSRNNYTHGMNLSGNSLPTITRCAFRDNGGFAIEGVQFAGLARFTDNTASGNGGNTANYARVVVGSVGSNLTLGPAAMISGAIVLDASISVDAGVALLLQAGTILKFRAAHEINVNGTLITNGTAQNPVVFTDLADDSAGGDTDGNGPSIGHATAWRGILFQPTSTACVLTRADIRYGGNGYVSNVHLNQADPVLVDCVIRNNYVHGINCSGNSRPTLLRCLFQDNGGFAVEGVLVDGLHRFTDNVATGNAANYARVVSGLVAGNVDIPARSMIGGAIVLDASLAVQQAATLTIGAGTVVKFRAAHEISVDGTLLVNGTAGSPVVFTDIADDSAGGDTNGDGPSVGHATAWRGMLFSPNSGASVLNRADVRYGGNGYVSHFHLNQASPTFVGCISRNCYVAGMNLSDNSTPTVKDCSFVDNAGVAVDGVPLVAVPGFTNNSASGNAGNYLQVTSAAVGGYLRIGAHSILGGALVMVTSPNVAPTGHLVVDQGVVFKFLGAHQVSVDGALDLRGTSYEPVVFTDFADDSIAGDTNNNGPTVGHPTAWRGVMINAGTALARCENVVIRYTGHGYVPGLTASRPGTSLRAVRVDSSYLDGFVLAASMPNPTNLVAWGCGGVGINLTGGAFDLLHATAYGNGSGIRKEAAFGGRVVNSISRGNATNFANFGSGTAVWYSDGGFAGVRGNIDVEPQFVDAAGGNLRLGPGSPCLGVADLWAALTTVKDFDENSRLLDHNLGGFPNADMGAFERPVWDMTVTGTPRIGQTLTFTVSGPPGTSFLGLGLLDGVQPFVPWGMLLAGANPGTSVALLYPIPLPVGFPMPLPLSTSPNLIGATAGIQTLTLSAGNPNLGNFTRLYRILVRP